nr:hypothetical protein Xcnt_04765 [Xanthomonas campestris pv. centellae]
MATITGPSPAPNTATSSKANTSDGNANSTFKAAPMQRSSNRPPSPAASPKTMATLIARAVAATPIASDSRAP